ncbi:MAG: copper resistance protein CopC [Actinomycetota bacterium]
MRWTRTAAVLIAALAMVLAIAGPTRAHAGFVSSTPEPGSLVSTAPGVVVLDFTEPLNEELSRATVTAPDESISEGVVTTDTRMDIPLFTGATGVYRVSWTTVSIVDGHTLTGGFSFGVGVDPGPGSTGGTQGAPRRGDLLIAVSRTVEDAALLLVVGLLLLGRLARRLPALAWVRTRQTAALAVAVGAGSLVVVGEGILAAGSLSFAGVATYLTSGTPGVARLLRPVLEALALLLSLFRPRLTAWPLVAALGALAAAGHAAAISPRWWGVGVQIAHLVSAGLWAGGVMALAVQHPPTGWRGSEGVELLRRFTRVALPAFAVTATTGIIRGFQETGGVGGLTTAYGLVLLAKVLLVLLMVQLSVLAWRRIMVRPRVESIVAVAVILAAALLASFPLPPGRISEAETSEAPGIEASALPRPEDLSLGSNAGEFLLGLTVRSYEDELAIYILGLGGPEDDATRVVTVHIDGREYPVEQCGPSCRTVDASVAGGERVRVGVAGPSGGTARFSIPELDEPSADGLLRQMRSTMTGLTSFRLTEILDSGRTAFRSEYEFIAPDAFHVRNIGEDGEGSEVTWIGDTRYLRSLPYGEWQIEVGVDARVPIYVWDSFEPFVGARVVGTKSVEGVDTSIVTFFGGGEELPAWFRLWVDQEGLVRRAEMNAPGHFMDQRYYGFDDRISIERPVEAGG